MNGQTVRPFFVKVSCFHEIRMAATITTGPIVPGFPGYLMKPATLAEFEFAIIPVTERSLLMPETAFGELIFYLVQSIHFLGMFVTVGFISSSLSDALAGWFPLFAIRSTATFSGAGSDLVPHSVEFSVIHSILVLLLGSTSKAAGEFRIDVTD